ncbi:MAG: hypothetical protein R3A45_02520 [Bdellovibrionota bacterium]
MNSFNIPAAITEIVSKLKKEHGFSTWVVGGAILNYFLHRHITDWDLSTSNARRNDADTFLMPMLRALTLAAFLLPSENWLLQITTLRKKVRTKIIEDRITSFSLRILSKMMRRDIAMQLPLI